MPLLAARQLRFRQAHRPVVASAAASALLLLAAPAGAQEGLEDLTVLGWALDNIRLGMSLTPDYIGSDDYRIRPSGSLSLSRRGETPEFGAPDDGVSVGLFGSRTWSAGVSGRWRSSRDDDHDLRGFEKIDGTVEAGAFVNWWPADWLRVRGEVRHGFGGHDSWVADIGADAIARKGPLVVSIGPRFSWADDDFTRTYFRVTPLEAARSPFGIQPFSPSGASTSAGILASAEHRLNRHWSIATFGTWRRLLGDAADSPIVADLGSREQFSATLGVRYTFGR